MIFGNAPQAPQHLLRLVMGNGVVAESLSTINDYISRAQTSLQALPATIYSKTLFDLTQYLSDQSHRLLKEPRAV